MRWPPITRFFSLLVTLVIVTTQVKAKTETVLVGEEIPDRLFISKQRTFFESDSLYLNGRLLSRNIDYSFDSNRGLFDLSRLEFDSADTLLVTYDPLPEWVQSTYGRSMPVVVPWAVDRAIPRSQSFAETASSRHSDITISGAKSFLFSARSAGTSNFSQSLDLRIGGSLAPGVEVTGAVSDRGYDPSYGPSNSRLSEIDRLNLTLRSKMVLAQVGDMAVVSRFDSGEIRNKRVSGASISVHTHRWYTEALAARPKGRFESCRFWGTDGLQGPYQIGQGSTLRPVVPGSEQVWLDGRLLERGADKDYTVDYPTGLITFSVNHPIDRRSRVEIDYEPRATDYRGELLSSGGGASVGDSALFMSVEFIREGDDRNQPLRGELSDDDKDLLAAAGDSIATAVRSGVTPDSGGSYILVVDSLPDSIYQYMGQGNGDYAVSFSFVGSGNGDYRFLGGDYYEFVGSWQGDYQPIILIPAPQRTDYYNARIGLNNKVVGDVIAEFRQTLSDRNLFSSRDDDDNRGAFYSIASKREWLWNDQKNRLTIKARRKEAAFKLRNRLYPADFNRSFLLPSSYVALTDESLYEIGFSVSPSSVIALSPFFSRLEYKDDFESSTGGLSAQLVPHDRVDVSLEWRAISAGNRRSALKTDGEVSRYSGAVSYRLSSRFKLLSSYEHDRRENDYEGESRGTRYNRYRSVLDGSSEKLSYEYYVEDSLTGAWREILSRNRVVASSNRKLGNLNANAHVTYQWLTQTKAHNESFLGRLHLDYCNARKRLNMRASYALSEETRNARGITYLEVERGQGDYVLEDGEYVPDPDGNYIRVEEILSERSRVSRGEKSFHLSKDFKIVLVRFNSAIREELLDAGKRQLWWAVPFISDDTQPYLFYSRRYDADIRLFPLRSGHAVNVTFSEDKETRDIAGADKNRRDATVALTLKQAVKAAFVEEGLELFRSDRDSYFGSSGETEGYKTTVTIRQSLSSHEISTGAGYRRAESAKDEVSETYSVHVGARLQVVKKGELRTSLELYHQALTNAAGLSSFQLTGNRPGSRGAIWSINLRYGLKGDVRMNFSLLGRHSDDRAARITGRGEMVVGF